MALALVKPVAPPLLPDTRSQPLLSTKGVGRDGLAPLGLAQRTILKVSVVERELSPDAVAMTVT